MANAYTMSGGQSVDAYSGSYNITPTTANVTLDTKDKILEEDLTIAGGGQLYGSSVKYGKSIFGVSGTGVELTYTSGVGTAYRNGQYAGDVITKVEQVPDLKVVGEMSEVLGKYTYTFPSNQYLISAFGDRYITTDFAALPTFYCYSNGTLITTTPLAYITGLDVSQLDYRYTVDIANGNVILGVITLNSSGASSFGCFMIQMASGGYKANLLLDEGSGSWSSPKTPNICTLGNNSYIAMTYLNNSGTKYYAILNSKTLLTIYSGSFNVSTDQLVYYRCILGNDGLVYVYNTRIAGSNIGSSVSDFIQIVAGGSVVATKSVDQSTLNFTGSSKLPSEYYTAAAYFVYYTGDVFIFYSSQPYYEYQNTGLTYVAKFNSSMSSKISDVPLNPQQSPGVSVENLSFYWDEDTSTIQIKSINAILRVALNGDIYTYAYGNTVLPLFIFPYVLESGEVDYINAQWVNTSSGAVLQQITYEDKSALKIKTITTSTYKATIEEV